LARRRRAWPVRPYGRCAYRTIRKSNQPFSVVQVFSISRDGTACYSFAKYASNAAPVRRRRLISCSPLVPAWEAYSSHAEWTNRTTCSGLTPSARRGAYAAAKRLKPVMLLSNALAHCEVNGPCHRVARAIGGRCLPPKARHVTSVATWIPKMCQGTACFAPVVRVVPVCGRQQDPARPGVLRVGDTILCTVSYRLGSQRVTCELTGQRGAAFDDAFEGVRSTSAPRSSVYAVTAVA